MKHLLRFFFLIMIIGTGILFSQLGLGDGKTVFEICFSLTLLIGGGAVVYFVRTKHKLFMVSVLLVFSVVSFAASTACADDFISAANFASQDKEAEYKKAIEDFQSASKGSEELTKYKEIMNGEVDATVDYELLAKANKAFTACLNAEFSTNYDETCKNAEKYRDIAGRVANGLASKCDPLSAIVKNALNTAIDKNSCWPCDVTSLVISSIQTIAASSYKTVRSAALSLLGGLFLLWLAFVTVVHFGKFGFARVSEYLTNFLNKAVLVLIVSAFLHLNVLQITEYTISPFVGFTAELTRIFSDAGRVQAKKEGGVIDKLQKIMTLGITPKCSYCDSRNTNVQGPFTFLDQTSINGLLCVICTVYNQVAPLISIGQGISCFASIGKKSNSDSSVASSNSAFSIPKIGPLLAGAFVVLIFSYLLLIICYYMIVSVLQLGFVVVLMPFWMIAFVFKPAREYAKNAWGLVMHAMGTLLSLSLNTAFVIIGFSKLLSGKNAAALGVAMLTGTPTDIMGAFTGESELMSGSGLFSGGGEDPFSMSGLLSYATQWGIDELIGVSPTHVILLLVAYAFISISMVNYSSDIAERILDVWMNRSADANGVIMGGIRTAGKGVAGVSHVVKEGAFAGAGLVGGSLMSKSFRRTHESLEQERKSKNIDASSSKPASRSNYRKNNVNSIYENAMGGKVDDMEKILGKGR